MLVLSPQPPQPFPPGPASVVDIGTSLPLTNTTSTLNHALPSRQVLLELQQQQSSSLGYHEVKSSAGSLPDLVQPTGEHPSVERSAVADSLPLADDKKTPIARVSVANEAPATQTPEAAAFAARQSTKAAKRAFLRSPLDVSGVLIPSAEVINDSTGRKSHAVSCGRSLYIPAQNPAACQLRHLSSRCTAGL